jgi:hypothetical protein
MKKAIDSAFPAVRYRYHIDNGVRKNAKYAAPETGRGFRRRTASFERVGGDHDVHFNAPPPITVVLRLYADIMIA